MQHQGRFVASAAHGLFRVDVFAGIHGVDGEIFVPVVRRGDEDRVDFLSLQQLTVVVESFHARRMLERAIDASSVDVAQGAHLYVRILLKQRHHVAAADTEPDRSQADAVTVSAENPRM